ncbi:MAG: LysR family transcriptional regulator [Planctomycetota bacterium]
MKSAPKIGEQFERRFIVGEQHLITFADEQMPAVLATPWLIAEMEYTARDSVAHLLEEHERTVGTAVDIRHLAPSLLEFEVTCTSRVIGYEDGEITFQVEAFDRVDLLARGVHRRRVVDTNRLRRRVSRKREA